MILIIFIAGLFIGSFLNVLIDRLPKGENVISGRSHCDFCRHKLAWYDLIPVFSFVALSAKCRYCGKKISRQYPLSEIFTGFFLSFTAYVLFSQNIGVSDFQFLYWLLLTGCLIVVFGADLKYRIIPDQIVLLMVISGFLYLFFFDINQFLNNFFSALAAFLIFLLLTVATKGKGMGLGDVKFAFAMGLVLGYPAVIVSFYLAFLTGAVFSLILVIKGKKKMKSTIPFGPFLAAATYVSLLFGYSIWSFSIKFMGF